MVCGLLFVAVVLSDIERLVLPTLKLELQVRYAGAILENLGN